MAGARAERAQGAEQAELERLGARLIRALSDEISGEDFVEPLIGRLVEAGEEAAEEALRRLVARYRERRAADQGSANSTTSASWQAEVSSAAG